MNCLLSVNLVKLCSDKKKRCQFEDFSPSWQSSTKCQCYLTISFTLVEWKHAVRHQQNKNDTYWTWRRNECVLLNVSGDVFVVVFFHIQASTCAGFCDSWVGLLGTEMFSHHFLEWTHEYWDKAVNVAGIVTARWFQDHQCSWKTNKFNITPKIKQILRVEWQVTDKFTRGKSFLPFTTQDRHLNRPRPKMSREP